jgi:hypothetical protein
MADLFNGIKENVSSVTDKSQILNGGVDKQRTNFLKGLKTTTSGQKEDPTYTGFRIMFDFGVGGLVDPETYLPISPLLSDGTGKGGAISTPSAFPKGMKLDGSKNFFHGSREQMYDFGNYTGVMHYMTAEGYLRERRTAAENGEAGPVTDINGKSIPKDNSELKNGSVSHRADALVGFKNLLNSVNEKSPWFIKSISGLSDILKVTPPRQIGGTGGGYKQQRSGVLTFDCLDSIDLRMNAMAELYRKATYDYQYHRELLPANLRKFRMYIIVTEIRQIDLERNLADVLNPFNIPGIGGAVQNIKNLADGFGLNKNKVNPPGNVSNNLDNFVKATQKLQPYILIYQLDLCEFDFDESYPFNSLSNERNVDAVKSQFKVHVGNAKEYKLQYNILSDLIKNESIFAPVLIQDSWNMAGSKILLKDVNLSNSPDLFKRLANNFVNNSVASVVQQQISPLVTSTLLGNAYGFNISDAVRSLNSVQDMVSGIKEMKNPFGDYRPQSKGLGGPSQRQYPDIREDVYPGVPAINPAAPGANVYPANSSPNPFNGEDTYPTNPGIDGGLPNRLYPVLKDDEYREVGGDLNNSKLGVPDYLYNTPKLNQDMYSDNPGADGGLPKRVYSKIKEDLYPTVPGSDSGVPDREYTGIKEDVYGSDPLQIGRLDENMYPNALPAGSLTTDDLYPNNPGLDSGLPKRVYPTIDENVYK